MVILLWCAAAAVWQWRGMRTGVLRWDGQAWWWRSDEDEMAVTVRVCWDLQRAALLYVQDLPLRARWTFVERHHLPARWDDLRRALHYSASAPVPRAGVASRP